MLTIRREQMAAFEGNLIERFMRHLCADLADCLPSSSESARRNYADAGIKAARALGLTRECDVAQFIFLMAAHGHEFVQPLPEGASEVLCAYGVDPAIKLKRLEDWLAKAGGQRTESEIHAGR